MTYYTNGFGADNVHSKANGGAWDFVKKGNEPHPNSSYAFYRSIFGNAAEQWNMKMLFTDFLCYRYGCRSFLCSFFYLLELRI